MPKLAQTGLPRTENDSVAPLALLADGCKEEAGGPRLTTRYGMILLTTGDSSLCVPAVDVSPGSEVAGSCWQFTEGARIHSACWRWNPQGSIRC
jgi:hypothetical protein